MTYMPEASSLRESNVLFSGSAEVSDAAAEALEQPVTAITKSSKSEASIFTDDLFIVCSPFDMFN